MNRVNLALEYFGLRTQKKALAEEFKARMGPICSRIKEIEELLEGCASCESGGCHTKPKLTVVLVTPLPNSGEQGYELVNRTLDR